MFGGAVPLILLRVQRQLHQRIVRALINIHNFFMGSRFLPYVIRVVKTHISNVALFQRKIRELGVVEGLTNQIVGKQEISVHVRLRDTYELLMRRSFRVIFLLLRVLDCYGSSDLLFYEFWHGEHSQDSVVT